MSAIADWFRWLNDATGINLTVFYDSFDGMTYLRGLGTALELAVACVVFSVAIGVVGGWLRNSPVAAIRAVMSAYVNFVRNTPSLVQLYFFYFGVGTLMPRVMSSAGDMRPMLDSFQWTVVALSLFGGAFNTEIFRAGIEAVPRTTIEAAEALGFSRLKIYLYVVLPLAFRISLPALNNNLVTLVKGTTIGYAIGVPELLTASATIWSVSSNVTEMMNLLLLTFLAIVSLMVLGMHWLERRLHVPGYGI